jgi:hypothetical protein
MRIGERNSSWISYIDEIKEEEMNNGTEIKQFRSFGFVVGGIFMLMSLWPTLLRGEDPRLWALILAGLLLIPASLLPGSLKPAYHGWMAVGQVLGWINTRIILGLIFYGLFTPIGVIRRFILGKDPMRRRFEPTAQTYRVIRVPRANSHFKQQF